MILFEEDCILTLSSPDDFEGALIFLLVRFSFEGVVSFDAYGFMLEISSG